MSIYSEICLTDGCGAWRMLGGEFCQTHQYEINTGTYGEHHGQLYGHGPGERFEVGPEDLENARYDNIFGDGT